MTVDDRGRGAFLNALLPASIRDVGAIADSLPHEPTGHDETGGHVHQGETIGLFDIFCLGPLAERFELDQVTAKLPPLLKCTPSSP